MITTAEAQFLSLSTANPKFLFFYHWTAYPKLTHTSHGTSRQSPLSYLLLYSSNPHQDYGVIDFQYAESVRENSKLWSMRPHLANVITNQSEAYLKGCLLKRGSLGFQFNSARPLHFSSSLTPLTTSLCLVLRTTSLRLVVLTTKRCRITGRSSQFLLVTL
jgi:hypothetical protein